MGWGSTFLEGLVGLIDQVLKFLQVAILELWQIVSIINERSRLELVRLCEIVYLNHYWASWKSSSSLVGETQATNHGISAYFSSDSSLPDAENKMGRWGSDSKFWSLRVAFEILRLTSKAYLTCLIHPFIETDIITARSAWGYYRLIISCHVWVCYEGTLRW